MRQPVGADVDVKLSAEHMQRLFDALPDVVFFVKDRAGRNTRANLTRVRRLRLERRDEVIGQSAAELFPSTLGSSYAAQDRRVLAGETVVNQLKVHLLPNRVPGWCITCTYPQRQRGEMLGVPGISRDLRHPDGRHPTYSRLVRAIECLQEHYAESVRV